VQVQDDPGVGQAADLHQGELRFGQVSHGEDQAQLMFQ